MHPAAAAAATPPEGRARPGGEEKLLLGPARRDVNAIVAAHLGPEISSMTEFHGLRILDPVALPTAKRGGLQNTRLSVPGAVADEVIRKVIKVGDIDRYISGMFDPQAGGFVALAEDTDCLVTPEGLRLDYPGGFAGETQVGELRFPQTTVFQLFIPFSPPMGGVVAGDYPFA